MNTSLASAVELAEDVVAECAEVSLEIDIAVMPPFVYLQAVGRALGHHNIALGAQDLWTAASGAYTGEISAQMIGDLGGSVVIVGHSERRTLLHESNELAGSKLATAIANGLTAVFCIGETWAQREEGQTEAVVSGQLRAGLQTMDAAVGETLPPAARLVIAYEPVWAIGTGRTATPANAQQVHASIRRELRSRYHPPFADSIRIIYGGSVTAANASELFAQPDIDGGLIGGASLKSADFAAICKAAGTRVP